MEELSKLSVLQIKDQLKKLDLTTSGRKAELVLRLHNALVAKDIDIADIVGNAEEIIAGTSTEQDIGEQVNDDLEPSDSVSQTSAAKSNRTGSSRSSRKSATAHELALVTAEKAALEAKAQTMRQVQELEEEESRIKLQRFEREQEELGYKRKIEKLKLEAELKAARAKEAVLQRYEEYAGRSNRSMGSRSVRPKVDLNLPFKDEKIGLANRREKDSVVQKNNGDTFVDCYRNDFDCSKEIFENTGSKQPKEYDDFMVGNRYRDLAKSENRRNVAPVSQPSVSDQISNQNRLLETLVSHQIRSKVPDQELTKFDGSIVAYQTFIKAFDSTIASRLEDDKDKLFYLDQYTVGEPKEIVQSCLLMSPEEGYKEARENLRWRYGEPEGIAAAYVDKVLSWPEIKRDDVKGLDRFAIALTTCRNAVSEVPHGIGELQNPKTLRRILQKVPYGIQESFRRKAVQIRESQGRSVRYEDLVDHVKMEAKVARDPQFGKHLFKPPSSGGRDSSGGKGSQGNSESRNSYRVNATREDIKCWYCEGPHFVYKCEVLEKMTNNEKFQAIKDRRLCYACLKQGHSSKFCRSRQTCQKCKMGHPTILHRDLPPSPPPVQSNEPKRDESRHSAGNVELEPPRVRDLGMFVNICSSRQGSGMSVVPVRIRASNGREVKVYAFLDNGSEATFCTSDLVQQLGVSGECNDVTLTVDTMNGKKDINSKIVSGLTVGDIQGNEKVNLPPIYVINRIPVESRDVIGREQLDSWEHLSMIDIPTIDANVELLIGNNVPHLLEPWEVVHSTREFEPHAVRTKLGWVVCGASNSVSKTLVSSRIVIGADAQLNRALVKAYNRDFEDCEAVGVGLSGEDINWLNLMQRNCRLVQGQYELPLPVRDELVGIPNSRDCSLNRLLGLRKKLSRDDKLKEMYFQSMQEMLDREYAELVPESELGTNIVWYIPHFAVTHPAKPGKIRIVHDCASKVKGISLNDLLMQGPDLNNLLVNVLLRFRQGIFAYSADIERMFLQVKVPCDQRNLLRFLWWDNTSFSGEPREYRMTVHLFGATSSPSCANFALQQTARDNGDMFDRSVGQTIIQNFYVDDVLKSMDSASELINNAKSVQLLCKLGGFSLKKFVSTSQEFVESFPEEDLSESKETLINDKSSLVVKTLGLVWDLGNDSLRVQIGRVDKPTTKRQLLSAIAGIFDPLGLAAPWVLEGRLIMQELCRHKLGWDDEFTGMSKQKVDIWIDKLGKRQFVSVPRCVKAWPSADIKSVQVHYFADASEKAFGVAAYIRCVSHSNVVYVGFLIGKGRVAPLKSVSIPRLELSAAHLAVKMHRSLADAISLNVDSVHFWTDSAVVLHYIRNNRNRYQTFVANRVTYIREGSSVSQWKYVKGELNPSDDVSRARQTERWLTGPLFLWLDEQLWPQENSSDLLLETIPEIKSEPNVNKVNASESLMVTLLERYSKWTKLLRAVAWLLKFIVFLLKNKTKQTAFQVGVGPVVASDLESSTRAIIKCVQSITYEEEISSIKSTGSVPVRSSLSKLKPMYDGVLLRVGGRLGMSAVLTYDARHPIILPSKHHVTKLCVEYYHVKFGHMGGNYVLSMIRQTFWILKGHATVRGILRNCVHCRKVKGRPLVQQMANLPVDRTVMGGPPFQVSGIDAFGPFYVKHGRGQAKRYGIIFTCFAIRAIHLEVVVDMSTDSFINSLRRFISRRGQVRKIYCDRGTNFVGAAAELDRALNSLNAENINGKMADRGVEFIFGPADASHFGGVWERMIGTVRRVLESIIYSQRLTDDKLSTIFCEVESIVNSRPLTKVTSDERDLPVLTPNQLLNVGPAPSVMGEFNEHDSYSKQRWRQVQYCADQFWHRWQREYLSELQTRQKWKCANRNLQVNDVVLVVSENMPRCHWPLATVLSVKMSSDNLVRSVTLRMGSTGKTLVRPISKLVLILEDE